MTEPPSPPSPPRRVIWLTPDQRTYIWDLVAKSLKESDLSEQDRQLLNAVLKELRSVSQRERISGRLVSNHVTGLMLPHDALPVRLTDDEADAILEVGVADRRLNRMLQTGPRKQGRR